MRSAQPAELASRAAYLLVGGRGGALAGWSAAELLVTHCAPRDAPAELLVDVHVRRHPGLRIRHGSARPDEVRERTGCRVTSFLGTAYDLGRWSELVVMISLGWRVLRVTSADVLGAADRTLAQVRALLALHGK
ncbi:MAG: hypothetical protein QOK26_4007 [Pseudonocardiales bacterium]|nr:hypothetical protein [Pseudonocardiales bacterium]